ncbi:butyrophilin-like protein 2 [Grus americana]|uniref:butyrophilin-like protein 2 n=1 Tax=Grus americana TaxID=9117 RepID=UPI002407C588|nr:butyrophilin-like protein 2 [Grus americana]
MEPDFSVVGPGHSLQVTVGQYVVLPCHLSPSVEARSLDIRWIRPRFSKTVHHYRNGEDLYSEQLREYVGRTELVRDGLSRGRLDLRISALRPSDDGQYICTVTDGASYGEATPATGSVPQLSLEAYEDGGIRVVCRSAGWYPQPDVLWKDPDGQHLPSASQRHSSDTRGLFSIEYVIVVTDGNRLGNWSCVVAIVPQEPVLFSMPTSPMGRKAGARRRSAAMKTQMWLVLSYLVTLHVLRLGSADFSVVGPDHPLQVTVGRYVVLPCHLSPSMDARSLDIRWIWHQVYETVHHYRNGEDLYREQMEEYDGRTELVRDGLSRGRLDLRISGLRPSDDGQYICTVTDGASYGEAMVDVEVSGDLAHGLEALGLLEQRRPATGSVPQLSLEAYEDGGMRVVCRSAGWYPQPEVLWKDPDGQHLPSVSQGHCSDTRGLFGIEDVIVVSNGNRHGKWSCVVRNSRLNQEQETSLHISETTVAGLNGESP